MRRFAIRFAQAGGAPFRILLALVAAVSLAVLLYGLNSPLTDLHSFRQSQTAISVYWMLHGGPWLDYWTPVLGASWSAPFEFPLFQWIVAGLVEVTGIPLDPAGRLVSYFWLICGLWPAARLCRDLRLPPLAFPVFAILLLASPTYLFWGRAFMFETQALALSLFFLLLARRAVLGGSAVTTLLAAAAGALAMLTKITTVFPFALAVGAIALAELAKAQPLRARAAIALRAALVVLPGLTLFALWNAHADALKAASPLASLLRSDAPRVVAWNFGTFAERMSSAMLYANLRAMADMFGIAASPLLILVAWALARARPERRILAVIAALLLLYLLPWLVLTNLHIVHDYYQTAIAWFAIAAVALAIGAVGERFGTPLALGLCVLVVASQLARFATFQGRAMVALPEGGRDLAIAALLKRETRPGEMILTYGLDWSALVPYYAERRARMEPSWTVPADYRARLPVPGAIGGVGIGAVVRCPSQIDGDPAAAQSFARLAAASRQARVADCLIYLPDRKQAPAA